MTHFMFIIIHIDAYITLMVLLNNCKKALEKNDVFTIQALTFRSIIFFIILYRREY